MPFFKTPQKKWTALWWVSIDLSTNNNNNNKKKKGPSVIFMKPLKLCFTIIPVVQEFEKKTSRNGKLRSLRNKFYLMLLNIAVYNVLIKKRMMLIFILASCGK